MNMTERVTLDGITAESKPIGRPDDGFDANWYQVTLAYAGRTMITNFGMGYGLTGYPVAAEVVNSLVSEAAGYENAQDFSDWASEYGYDEDSRRAYSLYERVGAQTHQLRIFLAEQYDAYLWDTEGL